VAIDDQYLVSFPFEQSFRIAIFEQQVRFAAAEVDATFEAPRWIQ
jgi:hypothetical protein